VGCAVANQRVPDGCYHLGRMLAVVVQRGGEVGCCGTCMDARAIGDASLVDRVRRSTLEQATDWTLWAEKVVSY